MRATNRHETSRTGPTSIGGSLEARNGQHGCWGGDPAAAAVARESWRGPVALGNHATVGIWQGQRGPASGKSGLSPPRVEPAGEGPVHSGGS